MKKRVQRIVSYLIMITMICGSLFYSIKVQAASFSGERNLSGASQQSATNMVTPAKTLSEEKLSSLLSSSQDNHLLTLPNGIKVENDLEAAVTNPDSTISKGITYTYQRNVEKIDLEDLKQKDGTLQLPEGTNIDRGDILVDENKDIALYVDGVNSDGSLEVRQPSISELFSDLTIDPDQIALNDSTMHDLQQSIKDAREGIHNSASDTVNISEINKNTKFGQFTNCGPSNTFQEKKGNKRSAATGDEAEVINALKGGKSYVFESTPLTAYTPGGSKITVTMSGDIAVNLNLKPKYSPFGGYDLGISGAEMINLRVKLDASMNEEIYIPLFGGDLNLGIGNVTAGIFLVVDVRGNITVVLSGGQGMSLDAGVKGGTCFGIPTSFHPYATPNYYAKGECDPNGQITATVALTPSIGLSVLGIEVFGTELRLGLQLYAQGSDRKLSYGLSAIASLHVAILGEGTYVFDINYKLFSREKEYFGGCFFYGNLCAYRDELVATVLEAEKAGQGGSGTNELDPFADKTFYSGPVQVYVYSDSNQETPIAQYNQELTPKDNGRLVLELNPKGSKDGIDIRKGYSVRVSIPNRAQAVSDNIYASIPFKGIALEQADFFNEAAWGEVQAVSKEVDQPGLANTYYKSNKNKELLYCANRQVKLEFSDPTGKARIDTVNLKTDSLGKFRLDQITATGEPTAGYYDIKPNREVKVVADIDGFPFESNKVTTVSGLELIGVTDCRTDVSINLVLYDPVTETYSKQQLSFPTIGELNQYCEDHEISLKFTEETFTSSDHFFAVNRYGYETDEGKVVYHGRKIDGTLNIKTEAYHTRRIAYYFADYKARINLAKLCPTDRPVELDLRASIMGGEKDLVYSENFKTPINESLNGELTWYCDGLLKKVADRITAASSRVSTAHSYHRFCMTNDTSKKGTKDNLFSKEKILDTTINSRLNPKLDISHQLSFQEDEYITTVNGNSVLLKPRPFIVHNQTDDLLLSSQPGGVDGTLVFDATEHYPQLQGNFNEDLYIHTVASMNIEGITLTASQWDPWLYSTNVQGTTNQQTADHKIDDFLSNPMNYMRQKIVIPAAKFENLRENEWKPAAGSMKHSISINTKLGTMTIDGIKTKMNGSASIKNNKISINVGSIRDIMHLSGSSSNAIGTIANGKLLSSKQLGKALGANSSVKVANGVVSISYKK